MPKTNTTHSHRDRSRWWRLGTPIVIVTCGTLFVVSALNSEGTDLRPGRYDDLSQLVSSESRRYQRLNDQVNALTAEVDNLATQISDRSVRRLQRQAESMRDEAGFTEVNGAGLSITMSDSDEELINAASAEKANLMVVHQQDIQAVVNALWRGGAEAITIAGQRIISTTGIKCTGSTITLQGVPYPQPFVIEAIGSITSLQQAIDDDPDVSLFRAQADEPSIAIGWDLTASTTLSAPAYSGLRTLNYAKPIRSE